MATPTETAEPTTPQRTHRYLRLALAGVVFAILVAVTVESIAIQEVLYAISHYYYTPARNVLVGSLFAASVAMLTLSGRQAESTLLDIAAIFAPLIAILPATIAPGSVPGLDFTCTDAATCVPDTYLPDVVNGIWTYLIVLATTLVLAVVLRAASVIHGRGTIVTIAVGVIVLIVLALFAFTPALRPLLLTYGHYTATALFFAAFAAVPILNAVGDTTDAEPTRGQRIVYLAVPAVIVVAFIMMLVLDGRTDFPIVLLGEAIALVAFAVFWVVQTVQRWHEPDPPSAR